MFIPNTTGLLSRKIGMDLYAQSIYAPAVKVGCSIVHLADKIIVTPIRADQSATRSNAEEEISVSKILFPRTVVIGEEDKFVISGISLRVTGIEERRDTSGQIDHYEVDFGMWQG